MQGTEFRQHFLKHFGHEPTEEQLLLVDKLSHFVCGGHEQLFVLKGYAGTGKTSLVSALVKALPAAKKQAVLMAPTGRAAKVLSNYSGQQAFTIHKKIYRRLSTGEGGSRFIVQPNIHHNTLFIVDEASMIPGRDIRSDNSLLDDLLQYVFSGMGCRLIFVGDSAQLPPVGLELSPALDAKALKDYHVPMAGIELKDVVRQDKESGILANATQLRKRIGTGKKEVPQFFLDGFSDIERISGLELEDALNDSYGKAGAEETIVVCRSNKRANIYNQQIRARIRWQESEISAGDYLMVVKNNYFWLPPESSAGFIANGDTAEVMKLTNREELDGFVFTDAKLRLVDYPNEPVLETKLLLNTIMAESPALSQAESKRFYEVISAQYTEITNKRKRLQKVKEDPYFNALQVKFAYAVTCHKAQGGQWKNVFVEQGYVTEEMINNDFLRWLYTGVTRATSKLYLVNFNKEFFE